jgi:hypothetical protein
MWTKFWDMHSGGIQKLKWDKIYIEAPEKEACVIFQNRFDRNPFRVTCTCCGEDYSVQEGETLEQVTGYHRGCHYDKKIHKYIETKDKAKYAYEEYQTVEEYKKNEDVLVIYAKDIKPSEREGTLREEGYVWRE